MKRSLGLGAAAGALSLLAAVPAVAAGSAHPVLRLDGRVTTPANLTLAQLQALATTFTYNEVTPRGMVTHNATGVPLETAAAGTTPAEILGSPIAFPALCGPTPTPPCIPNDKNELLRATVTVRGGHDSATFAVGELDPNFGNHPAYIVLAQDGHSVPGGPRLVVPNDFSPARFVAGVREVTVGVTSAYATNTSGAPCSAAATCPMPGSVRIVAGRHVTTLTLAQLETLPQETFTVSYKQGTSLKANQETGPSLESVLRAAGIPANRVAWVTGLGNDNYATTVTPGEQLFGGRPLMVSLHEFPINPAGTGLSLGAENTASTPRLIPVGDHNAGGRYGSDVLELVIGMD